MVRGDKHYVNKLVRLLKMFIEASGMQINSEKSCAYRFDKYTHKLPWLEGYDWRRGEERDLSKVLGTLFGLNLTTLDVD